MKEWYERTTEEANLFNPAFCCQLLTATIKGYNEEKNQNMPFLLLYLILPIVLYKHTREILPRSATTSFVNWIQENQIVKIYIPNHIILLKKYTQESLMFGIQQSIIRFNQNGELQTPYSLNDIKKRIQKTEGETSECYKKAFLLGKWFAKVGPPYFIYTLLGVKP